MRRYLALARRRVGDDSGHVGILMAMVLFVVVGMLMMTWNTANLSKEKMRLQNAADSAALGFCTWQARGLNAIQNINDEMYVSLSFADTMLKFAVAFEAAAIPFDVMRKSGFWPTVLIGWAGSQAFHIMALLSGGMSGLLASRICPWILRPLGYFYAYGSTALGWWGAEQLARLNRADPLGNVSLHFLKHTGVLGIFAIGFSKEAVDTVVLPVSPDEETGKKMPWKRDRDRSDDFQRKTSLSIYRSAHKILGTGKPWHLTPWVSKRGDKKGVGVTPAPCVWIAMKGAKHIETMPLDVWQREFASKGARKLPMFAVAAAQCITGDVVANSKKPKAGEVNQRTAGFGTGATAKLVPVAQVLGKAVGTIVYH